ncbi:MAG: LysM peptidoglycan-binding domain-containing M23 family metallopeptidase [Trichodesmium sp. MAG_R04]|nr:LysM peptidoglycan-binding domain-containing M23 family metallopeptidase [Trichodesmium sp. MAG_R04]
MKRTFPNKNKSVAQCEINTEASIKQTKQVNIGSSKACSSAAMIGLAAISTTMGASGILFPGEGDCAIAAELPQVDTNQQYSYEIRIPKLNATGVKSSKGLLLEKLAYVNTEENRDSKVGITQSETVMLSDQQLGNSSFLSVELKQKNLNQGQSNNLPPLEILSTVKVQKAISNHSHPVEKFKTGIYPVLKQKNTPVKSLVEWKSGDLVSESLGNLFNPSKKKLLEKDTYQKPTNLVVAKPVIEIANPKLNNNYGPKQVAEDPVNIPQESINNRGAKLEEVVVINSDITSTPISLVYKVRVGDTLSLIANQHNVSVGSLAKINQIKDPDLIEAAKLLKIPQQTFLTPLTLPISKGRNFAFSGKQEFTQSFLETTNNYTDFPEAKISIIKSDYSSYSRPSVSEPKVSIIDSSNFVSSFQAANQEYQINHKSKEFITSRQSVDTHSSKTSLVNGKVWPNYLTSQISSSNFSKKLETQIHPSNNQSVHSLPVNREIQDSKLIPVTQTDNQENPYVNRLRSEITRLRQEYNDQKYFEESQLTNSESINTLVPEPLSSENNISTNNQVPINKNVNNGDLKPTYQLEISNTQTRQWSQEIETNRPERSHPVIVMKESPVAGQISKDQESSLMAAASAPMRSNVDQILNSPSIGKMVSPDWPPLGQADTYLPDDSMQFTGYTWPARGVLTSGYGWRWGRMHRGIDIAAPTGTPIIAAAPGIVTYADWNSGGYGNLVEIQHPNGSLTIYAHNSQILVKKGQKVSQGELIAKMGSTGRSTGPHLHFEIHPQGNGAVNPMAHLPSGMAYN